MSYSSGLAFAPAPTFGTKVYNPHSDLLRLIHERDNSFKRNSIAGTIFDLDVRIETVEKPSRGLYRIKGADQGENAIAVSSSPAVREEAFYGPFAEWLKNDLEDVTKAIPLGGNKFRDKWGTPDVIGKRAPRPSDIVKPPIEIVAAEIKTNISRSSRPSDRRAPTACLATGRIW